LEGVDTVINCTGATRCDPSGESYWETNAIGTEMLLTHCEQVGVKRFIHISTIVAHDSGPYSESKLAGENYVRAHGMNYLILRPCHLLGPNEKTYVDLASLIKRNWKYVVVFGLGNNVMFPSVYVKDFASACVDAALSSLTGQTFNFLGPTITHLQFVRAARKALGLRFLILPMPKFIARIRIGKEQVERLCQEYSVLDAPLWSYAPTPLESILRESYFEYIGTR
jgi:nucleoside-diphosphate-sugar epimerase